MISTRQATVGAILLTAIGASGLALEQQISSPPTFDAYSPSPVDPDSSAVQITYTEQRETERGGSDTPQFVTESKTVTLPLDTDLDELDLPPNGKRTAVLAVTAARHQELLKKLKEADTEEAKEKAVAALEDNYTRHYAIETWWREQKLAGLEERLAELRAQVEQRREAQTKYVEATMTIAQLWVDGIGIAPPVPRASTDQTPMPYAGTTTFRRTPHTVYEAVPVAPSLPGPAPRYNTRN